jgi:hypothetical protein
LAVSAAFVFDFLLGWVPDELDLLPALLREDFLLPAIFVSIFERMEGSMLTRNESVLDVKVVEIFGADIVSHWEAEKQLRVVFQIYYVKARFVCNRFWFKNKRRVAEHPKRGPKTWVAERSLRLWSSLCPKLSDW